MTRPVPLLPLLLSLSLAACARPPASSGDAPPDGTGAATPAKAIALGDYHWRLVDAADPAGKRIAALLVRPDQPILFDFADDRIAVGNACNQISGQARVDGDRVRVPVLISTKMACVDPALSALDGEISRRIEGESRFEFQPGDPPRMLWTAANGDVLRFVGEPTPQTRYGGPGTVEFIEVAPQTEPCRAGLEPSERNCLRTRALRYGDDGLPVGEPGEWRVQNLTIQGFHHEPGIRTVLRVRRFPIPDAPADTPQVAYVLETVIESEMVGP
ncbi:MAG: DUF4377 domain-containing protein [Pseudomonadota bacterium]